MIQKKIVLDRNTGKVKNITITSQPEVDPETFLDNMATWLAGIYLLKKEEAVKNAN